MARSGSQERTKGASQQAQGRLKEAIGALTGNGRQAKQGRADQGRGRLRERWGHPSRTLCTCKDPPGGTRARGGLSELPPL
jgi:uncharacterized protein YjbJ (UPF0337 family)